MQKNYKINKIEEQNQPQKQKSMEKQSNDLLNKEEKPQQPKIMEKQTLSPTKQMENKKKRKEIKTKTEIGNK